MRKPHKKSTINDSNIIDEAANGAKAMAQSAVRKLRENGIGKTTIEDDIPTIDLIIDLLAAQYKKDKSGRALSDIVGNDTWEAFKKRESKQAQQLLSHIFDRLRDDALDPDCDIAADTYTRLSSAVDRIRKNKLVETIRREFSGEALMLISEVISRLESKKLLTPEDKETQAEAYFGIARAAFALAVPIVRMSGRSPQGGRS